MRGFLGPILLSKIMVSINDKFESSYFTLKSEALDSPGGGVWGSQ